MNKKMNSNIETRASQSFSVESRTIEGYAIVFNSLSHNLGGFREQILPEAIEGVLEKSCILALLNHDESRGVLARYRNGEGSLELTVDEKGLKYRFEAPHTQLGDELVEGIKRGDITTSSFAFTIADEDWSKDEEGGHIRTIRKFDQLYDISPVYREAYGDTSVALRNLDKAMQEKSQEEEVSEIPDCPEVREDYYKDLITGIFG